MEAGVTHVLGQLAWLGAALLLAMVPGQAAEPAATRVVGETVVEAEHFSRGHVTIDSDGWGRGSSPLIIDRWPGPIWVEYDLVVPTAGRYRLDARYASAEIRSVRVFLDQVLVDDQGLSGTTGSFRGTTAAWSRVAVLPLPVGQHTLRLEPHGCLPHTDALRLAPTNEPLHVPALTPRAERVRAQIGQARALAKAQPALGKTLRDPLARAEATLRAIPGAASVAQLKQRVVSLERDWQPVYSRLQPRLTAQAYGTPGAAPGYAVGIESPARKVLLRAADFTGEIGAPARIALARGEEEGVQVVVLAGKRPLRGVRVTAGALVGPAGARLPVAVHPVGYLETTGHPERGDTAGAWWPDPLLGNAPFGVAAERAQPVWLSVRAPATARPGCYRGVVVVAPEGQPAVRVPLQVEVWNFTLPPENHLKTAFILWWSRKAVSPAEFRQWAGFALRHRLGLMDIGWGWGHPEPAFPITRTANGYDYSRLDRDLQFCFDWHMRCSVLADFPAREYSEEYRQELARFLPDYIHHLRERGWLDRFYLKLHDEPQPELYPAVRAQAELVRQIAPGIRRVCTVPITPELIGAVDVWCPITSWLDPAAAREARARGEEVWAYTCGGPAPPTPNIAYIHQDARGNRQLPWQCWALGASGYLYWSLKHWPEANTTQADHQWSAWRWAKRSRVAFVPRREAGPGWPCLPWVAANEGLPAGDGYLIYPGPKGEPLSSIRLEAFRDGLEDVEYLAFLRRRAANAHRAGRRERAERAERLLAEAQRLGALQGAWNPDPGELLRLRARIGAELSRR